MNRIKYFLIHWGWIPGIFIIAVIFTAITYYDRDKRLKEGTDFVVVTICDKNEDGKSMCWNEYRTVNSLPNWKKK